MEITFQQIYTVTYIEIEFLSYNIFDFNLFKLDSLVILNLSRW